MSYTNGLDDPTLYFNTKLYTGNGGTNNITGVGFQPDWVWIKSRSDADNHRIFDSVRGATKVLNSNLTNAEATTSSSLTSFDSDGFSLGGHSQSNGTGKTFASWNWLASNTTASNTDGSITSTVSANTTSGFSIVSYTGTGSNATVGHGLSSIPKMVIVKDRGNAIHWLVGGDNIGWTKNLYLSLTSAEQTYNHFQDQSPSSSVVYMTSDAALNGSSRNYIMYCFAEKKGFSKFGSYTGNGNADGNFVYTGMKPSFVIVKNSSLAGENWVMLDNKRDTKNPTNLALFPNLSNAESGTYPFDFVSNGFKIRDSSASYNRSGDTFIYMAFAESPFVTSTGIPTVAR